MTMMVPRVVPKLVALYCLLFLMPSIAAAAAANEILYLDPPMALPNCTPTCGNLMVPYPFGIGPGCFLDKLYEIECRQGSNSAPVAKLKNLMNVIVLGFTPQGPGDQIGLEEAIEIFHPILYSSPHCFLGGAGSGGITRPLNLTGSPYVYSHKNMFMSSGCNNLALLVNLTMTSAVIGCKSSCGPNWTGSNYDCLNGTGCCMTRIPFGLQAYDIDFRTEDGSSTNHNGSCRSAFLVDRSWPKSRTNIMMEAYMSQVPVALRWGILNETFLTMPISLGDYQNKDQKSSYWCRPYSFWSADSDEPTAYVHCRCSSGFAGNPYIPNGCKDINECLIPNATSCPGKCVNLPGTYLCVDVDDNKNNNKVVMIGIGSGMGAVLYLGLLRWLYNFLRRKHEIKLKEKFFRRNGGLLLPKQLSHVEGNYMEKSKLFTSKELEKATNHFDENRILGHGGQGTVYKGMLIDGRIVAVKKSRTLHGGQVKQFINELTILSQINHRNIVKLLGCCLETEVPLLVYEFIPNGTLYQHLTNPTKELPMPWEMRLRIATEVAGALSYLHFTAAIPIYHRDVKSSNILLDEKYQAKVADFGTSRSIAIDQTHLTTAVKGTIGYLDPEYFQTSQFTDKSDVYSFGVVLVELLTGQKPISEMRAEDGRSLVASFITSMDNNCLLNIVDARVVKQGSEEEIMGVANLAKRCLKLNGKNRPTMKEAAIELERIRAQHVNPSTLEQNHDPIDHERAQSIQALHGCSTPVWSEARLSSSEFESLIRDLER